MSRFNTDTICLACSEDEQAAPGYPAARDAERQAVKNGDYNFAGIGLSQKDICFLKERRDLRAKAGGA